MISAILSILSSSGFGAVLGILGSFFTRMEERKKQKQEHELQIRLAEIALEESRLDREHELAMADKQRIQAETEGRIASELIDSESFKESIISSGMKSGIKIIDGIRTLMRPIITIYLLVISSMVAFKISGLIGGLESFETAKLFDIYTEIISDLSFLTMTAVTWWFGTRKINKN